MTVKKANGGTIVDAAMASVNPSPTPSPLEVIRGLYKTDSEGTTAALIEATVGLIGKGLLNPSQTNTLVFAALGNIGNSVSRDLQDAVIKATVGLIEAGLVEEKQLKSLTKASLSYMIEATIGLIEEGLLTREQLKKLIEAAVKAL
jgi:hypothetical protein